MKSRDKKRNENKLHVWKSLFFVVFLDKTKQNKKSIPDSYTFAREEVCFRQVSEVKPKSVTSVTRSCGCVSLSRPPLRLSHRVSPDNLCVSSATPERISGDTDDGEKWMFFQIETSAYLVGTAHVCLGWNSFACLRTKRGQRQR